MFQADYVGRLIEIGERDALAREERLRQWVLGSTVKPTSTPTPADRGR